MKLINQSDFEEVIKKHNIKNVTNDSRENQEGAIFVAVKGFSQDGNEYIEDVFTKGVSAVLTDDENTYKKYISKNNVYLTDNARKAMALLSICLYKSAPEILFAVTGTNGKTSVVHYINSLAKLLGLNYSSIGTLGVKYNIGDEENEISENLTSPDSITLNKTLNNLANRGVEVCAMEASSIGLDQYRLFGRKFISCGFTSFSQDHLDYHKNFENYLNAKLLLFKDHMNTNSVAIINSDMNDFDKVREFLVKNNIKFETVGRNGDLKFTLKNSGSISQEFEVEYKSKKYLLKTSIIGLYQLYNILISSLMLNKAGFDINDIFYKIHLLKAPEGRLEAVSNKGKGARIFIDYAHTPDALENILKELSKIKNPESKLICVFGCGGDRDKEKRPLMGKIADKYSDIAIITDDNPRFEDPEVIREEIARQINNPLIIDGRKNAIKHAISIMQDNDILVIAGKGHENYQIIRGEKLNFSDKKCALEYLNS